MKIKAISFNIRCDSDPNGHAISERAPRLNSATSKYDADVIGFQECVPEWVEYIEKYYSEKYEFFNRYRSDGEDKESTPILWKKDKFELIDKGCFWLSATPEVPSRGWDPDGFCNRICLYVVLKDKKTGEKFTFMNTHFGFGDTDQVNSAKLIYEYSKKISDYPTFVTGDFNMEPDSAGYKTMTKNFTDVNAVTAKDMRTTFHDYKLEPSKVLHIDYCFTDEKITPVSQKMIEDTFDGKFPSDHYGLYVELETKK